MSNNTSVKVGRGVRRLGGLHQARRLSGLGLDPAAGCACSGVPDARLAAFPGGTVVLVNWLGQSDDPCTGEEAAGHFIAATRAELRVERTERHIGYRLDLLTAV